MSRSYDGVDDQLSIASNSVFDGNGTIFMFVKTDGGWNTDNPDSLNRAILVHRMNVDGREGFLIHVHPSTGIAQAEIWNSASGLGSATATTSIIDDVWHSVAFTWRTANGSEMEIWIDGVSEDTGTVTSAWSFGNHAVRIGDGINFFEEFAGRTAHFFWFNRNLTTGEIQQIHNYPGSITRGLVMWWPTWGLNSPEPDWSGNQRNATVSGAINGLSEPKINGLFHPPRPRSEYALLPTAEAVTIQQLGIAADHKVSISQDNKIVWG